MTIALLVFVITRSNVVRLDYDNVVTQAEYLSRSPYEPRKPIKSDVLRKLGYDGMRDIRYKDDARLWRDEGLPFQAAFLLAGGAEFAAPVTIFQVNREGAGPVRFDPERFTVGEQVGIDPAEVAGSDYSGFRVFYPINKPNVLDEILVFQGASYFRFLGRSEVWGISARGIATNTLGDETFPAFTTFWLVQPENSSELTIYALLDGEALTGAYEFRVVPGPETKIHVRATLFPREDLADVGFAPLTSMFWFGENTSNTFGDFRPEVHDSDGLQILLSSEEWVWRPLSWAKKRQVNIFKDSNPKGFGLFQRDRDFSHYQDLEANYHQRPSMWVQPDGEWGPGEVVLMQNPASHEYADNVVAYWRPGGGLSAREKIELRYTIVAFTENAGLPPTGRCVSTRIDYQDKPNYRYIVVDFDCSSPNPPDDADIKPDVWVDDNGILSDIQIQRIPNSKIWRVNFGVNARDDEKPVEMRCALTRDDHLITETWTYTWVD